MTLPLLLSQQDDFEQLKSATPIDFGSLFIRHSSDLEHCVRVLSTNKQE